MNYGRLCLTKHSAKMLRNVPSVARNVAQGYMKVQGDYLEVFRSSIEVYDGKTYFNQQVSHWFDDYFFSHIQVRSTLEEALGNFFLEISFVVHPVGVVMELWWRNSRIVSLLSQRESPERSKGPRADMLLSHSRRNHQHRVPLAESFYTWQNVKMLTELIIASITNLN